MSPSSIGAARNTELSCSKKGDLEIASNSLIGLMSHPSYNATRYSAKPFWSWSAWTLWRYRLLLLISLCMVWSYLVGSLYRYVSYVAVAYLAPFYCLFNSLKRLVLCRLEPLSFMSLLDAYTAKASIPLRLVFAAL